MSFTHKHLCFNLKNKEKFPEEFYQDKIILNNTAYAEIFGEILSGKTETNKKRIVKIKLKDGKNIIYRIYLGGNVFGLTKDEAYLTYQSIRELTAQTNIENLELHLTKGCDFKFIWFHPDLLTRMVFKFGVASLIVSIISLIFSFISFLV
jgi:hypothetical protein